MRRLIVLAFIWGWSFLFIKVAVAGMSPATVAFARVALGAVVLSAFLAGRGGPLPRGLTQWRHLVVMAVTYSAVPFTLLAWGEQHISSALASVLNASTPLFAALMTAALLGERLRASQLGGLALGFVGVGVAAGVGGADVGRSSLAGVLAVVGTSACYGFAFAYAQRHLADIPPLVAATGQLVIATVVLAPLAAATTVAEGLSLSPTRLAAVGLLGMVGTGVAYVVNYRLIADLGSTRASVVTYLVPVVAVAVGVAFLHEPFRLRLLVGGALTIAGVAMVHERLGGRRTGRVAAP